MAFSFAIFPPRLLIPLLRRCEQERKKKLCSVIQRSFVVDDKERPSSCEDIDAKCQASHNSCHLVLSVAIVGTGYAVIDRRACVRSLLSSPSLYFLEHAHIFQRRDIGISYATAATLLLISPFLFLSFIFGCTFPRLPSSTLPKLRLLPPCSSAPFSLSHLYENRSRSMRHVTQWRSLCPPPPHFSYATL